MRWLRHDWWESRRVLLWPNRKCWSPTTWRLLPLPPHYHPISKRRKRSCDELKRKWDPRRGTTRPKARDMNTPEERQGSGRKCDKVKVKIESKLWLSDTKRRSRPMTMDYRTTLIVTDRWTRIENTAFVLNDRRARSVVLLTPTVPKWHQAMSAFLKPRFTHLKRDASWDIARQQLNEEEEERTDDQQNQPNFGATLRAAHGSMTVEAV